MSEPNIKGILGVRDDETIEDAARRVVRGRDEAVHEVDVMAPLLDAVRIERDKALAEVARLKAEAESWGNIPLMLQKRREFLRDDRLWEAAKAAMVKMIDGKQEIEGDMSARDVATVAVCYAYALLAEFDRAREAVPTPPEEKCSSPEELLSKAAKAIESSGNVRLTWKAEPTPPAETVSERCRRTHEQWCHVCDDAECADNENQALGQFTPPAEPKPAEPEWLTAIGPALDALHGAMCISAKDYARYTNDAWIYGIVVGWDEDSEKELLQKFPQWTTATIMFMRAHHAAIAAAREACK